MKKSLFLGGVALLAIGTAALAQPRGERDGSRTRAEVAASIDARFAKLDANQDGVLDEADRAARQSQRFAKLDADNDGALTQAELAAGHEARREKVRPRRANRSEASAERKAKWAERREQSAGRRGDRFAAMDSDGNGSLSAAEWAAKPKRQDRAEGMSANTRRNARHGRRGMGIMKMADANGDGAISLEEMRNAALARFDKVDTDGDGTISAAERQAVRDAHKAQRAAKQAG